MLTPLAVGPGQPFPYISGLSLSLGVLVRDDASGEERFARVKVPEGLPRFVQVGSGGLRLPLEAVIGHFLGALFPEMEVLERVAFRLTRDGDTEISDDADDLLEAVESELRKRRFGAVVRLEVSSSISRSMLTRLETRLGISPPAVYPVKGLLDLADVGQLYALDRPDLKYAPWVAYTQRRLLSPKNDDIFAEIAQRDLVVQHPYDSFATSVEAFVTHRGARPGCRRDQDHRLPDDRRTRCSPTLSSRRPRTASSASASSSSRRASTSAATSNGRARSSRRASTSSTGSPT